MHFKLKVIIDICSLIKKTDNIFLHKKIHKKFYLQTYKYLLIRQN
jgi:hypothetical protein